MMGKDDERPGRTVRTEAGRLRDEEITESQREAGNKALALLAEMADRAEDTRCDGGDSFLPPIRHGYFNTTILLDGERGVGKTALLVSLVDVLVRAFDVRARRATPAPSRAKGPGDASARLSWREERIEDGEEDPAFSVSHVHKALVPIGILDLQPLPPWTHLLLHILSRFKRLVDDLRPEPVAEHGPWEATRPWNAAQGEFSSAQDLRNLLVAAAIGWTGSGKKRYDGMDIESHAAELEEEAGDRLQVAALFHRFIDSLANDFQKKMGLEVRPVFVLAIDDADLEPKLSRQLVPLLRLLLHPRLALLLAGNSNLFLETIIGEWATFYAGARDPNEKEDRTQWQSRWGFAKDLYDKSIPPRHRCHVGEIRGVNDLQRFMKRHPDLFESLRIRQPDGDHHDPTIESLLKEVPLFIAALPGRIRVLLDQGAILAEEILKWKASGTPADPARVVGYLARTAIETAAWRDLGRDIYYNSRKAAIEIEGDAHRTLLNGFGEMEWPHSAETSGSKVDLIVCPQVFDWVDGEPGWRRVEAAYVLACWIGAHQRSPLFVAPTTGGSEGRDGLFASGRVRVSEQLEYTIFWPSPGRWPHIDVAAKALRWRRWVQLIQPLLGSSLRVDTADWILRGFLMLWHTGTLSDRVDETGLLPLTYLARPLEDSANVYAPFRSLGSQLQSWVVESALLAAPEYGLPAKTANAWLAAFSKETSRAPTKAWRGTARRLDEFRRKYLGFALESAGAPPERRDNEVKRLDEAFPEYDWASRVTLIAKATDPPSNAPEEGAGRPAGGRRSGRLDRSGGPA